MGPFLRFFFKDNFLLLFSVLFQQCKGTIQSMRCPVFGKTWLDDYDSCNLQMVFCKYTFLNCWFYCQISKLFCLIAPKEAI